VVQAGKALIAAGEASTADLFPYLFVLGLGFLVAAWGKSLGSAIGVIAGLLLILAAIIGFIIEFPACPGGTRCF
jgi:uncharacterized membrane protein